MLVLALPAKSFQLYFNFIQSAAPPPLLPPRVIAYFRTNGGGWKEKGTCIVIINYSRGTETDKEREREITRDFQFLHNNGDCSIPRGIAANL